MTQTLNRQAAMSYAIALYELGISPKDIECSSEIVKNSPELEKILTCPVVSGKCKISCIDKIFPEGIRNFLKVVCSHQKCGLLVSIFDCYKAYALAVGNVQNAVLRCVTPPKESQLEGIKGFLLRRFKASEVRIEIVKDPSLIGGFIIEAGGCEFDYSMRGRFHQLEQKLIRR